MSWLITPQQKIDPDAAVYLSRVEAVDGHVLEAGVRTAVDNFVVGCKADGIWDAIKASCILAGARTRLGALTPLKGAAPTSFNFVDGDYNRETGLVGDGSTKYLNSNRNNNADPQNNRHMSVFVSTAATSGNNFIGSGSISVTGNSGIVRISNTSNMGFASACSSGLAPNVDFIQRDNTFAATGFYAHSRSLSGSFVSRIGQVDASANIASQSITSVDVMVFARNDGTGSGASGVNARLAFYSIGESLDLAKLDGRVTTLINAIAAAIP